MTQEQDELYEELVGRVEALYERVLQNLPDGIHRHADGKLYFHQTWWDPRRPHSKPIKHIDEFK